MITATPPVRHTVGVVANGSGTFGDRPAFTYVMSADVARSLIQHLKNAAPAGERRRVTITASAENPHRLRLTWTSAPQYELRASTHYVRGESLTVQGVRRRSLNLDLSVSGAQTLADTLGAAVADYGAVAMIVSKLRDSDNPVQRPRNLVEFVSAEAIQADNIPELAAVGGALLSQVLEPEDFSDWETDS